ncbi:MAG: hypothetical protein REI94_16480 [Moraxellaceae bacterium]|nr:hypothetical protein [Moraxellaceae bacterium]
MVAMRRAGSPARAAWPREVWQLQLGIVAVLALCAMPFLFFARML